MKILFQTTPLGLLLMSLLLLQACSKESNTVELQEPKPSETEAIAQMVAPEQLNYHTVGERGLSGIIAVTDSGWSTETSSSNCSTGQADNTWHLTLTQPHEVTISVTDCCCPGDYFEVYADGNLLGITPNLAPPWGCSSTGPTSSGSFSVTLCHGLHIIQVRNAGYDGHSQSEIVEQNMCPASFNVSASVELPENPRLNDPVLAFGLSEDPNRTPLSQQPYQTDPEVAKLLEMLQLAEKVVQTDAQGYQSIQEQFDSPQLSTENRVFAQKLVEVNNRMIKAAQEGQEINLTPEDYEFIEPLFLYFAMEGNMMCGTTADPDPCPDRVASGFFFCTAEELVDHLVKLDYHQTAGYAGGSSGIDYTLVVDHPCGNDGPFRNHVLYFQMANGLYTYKVQGPEPNPEILSYLWPYFNWGFYVRWWHLEYC